MAIDANTLFQALINADNVAQKESPYAPFGDFASSLGQSIIQASPKYKPGESAVAGLIAGLVSGGANRLTDNYRDKQNELAEQVLSGRVLDRPDGMSPGVFSTLRNSKSLLALQRQLDQQEQMQTADLQTQEAIKRAEQLAPIDVATDIAKEKARLQLAQETYGKGPFSGLAGVPSGLQDDVLKQGATAAENAKAQQFIDEQFDQAKGLKSILAAIPGTTSANDMTGIQIALTNALQKVVGRELNEGTRKQLIGALPDWNDTAAQIDAKRLRFKGIIDTISPSTPLAQSVQDPTNNAISVPGGDVQKAQALEILRQRGVIK